MVEDGTEVVAKVSVAGQGLRSAMLASATCALLTAGVLTVAVERIGLQLEGSR